MEIIDADNPGKNISKVKKQKLVNDLHTGTTILFSLITLVRARNDIKRNIQDNERNNPKIGGNNSKTTILWNYGLSSSIFSHFYSIFQKPSFGGNNKGTKKQMKLRSK